VGGNLQTYTHTRDIVNIAQVKTISSVALNVFVCENLVVLQLVKYSPKVMKLIIHYGVYKSLSLNRNLSHNNAVHILAILFLKIYVIILPCTSGFSSGSLQIYGNSRSIFSQFQSKIPLCV
jgi:hypothetical protein